MTRLIVPYRHDVKRRSRRLYSITGAASLLAFGIALQYLAGVRSYELGQMCLKAQKQSASPRLSAVPFPVSSARRKARIYESNAHGCLGVIVMWGKLDILALLITSSLLLSPYT